MKTLFFAPHAALWIHAFPEALSAEALKQSGHDIVYVTCSRLLKSHCICMGAMSVPFSASDEAKERICKLCIKNADLIREKFQLVGPDLASLALPKDFAEAEEILANSNPAAFPDLRVEGLEVGRIALYEIVIQGKRATLDLDSTERARYRANLKNCIVLLRILNRLFDDVRPDRLVVYNALYSVTRLASRIAETRGVPQFYLHAGDNLSMRLQTLVLARDHAFSYYASLVRMWPEFENVPSSLAAIKAATNHFLEVARGRSMWAYSAAAGRDSDLRARLKIRPSQKVLVATMSSDDERFGAEVSGILEAQEGILFPRQVDWIRYLIDFVKSREDIFLVIRVHPREFPNKREGVLSAHGRMLQDVFVALPANAAVNWPTDGVSLYDLAQIADVFANAWSTAGREMALLGFPVVLYARTLTLYPPSLNHVGVTLEEYGEALELALREGWDWRWILKAYRFASLEFNAAIDISESFTKREGAAFHRRAASKALRHMGLTWEQRLDCAQRARSLRYRERFDEIVRHRHQTASELAPSAEPLSSAQEMVWIRHEIGRIAREVYGGSAESAALPLSRRLLAFSEGAKSVDGLDLMRTGS